MLKQSQSSEVPVLERLLAFRNKIAHGVHLEVDVDDYHTFHDRVLVLIDEFGSQVSRAGWAGAYRRTAVAAGR